jgi:Family of unknown function (DUF5923)
LIYSNSEFRKLLSDASILLRDIFADAVGGVADITAHVTHQALETAEQQRPSQSELDQIDQPAERGQMKDTKLPSQEEVRSNADQTKVETKNKEKEVAKDLQRKAKMTRDDVQDYVDKKFPKERQEAIINRIKRVNFL